MHFASQATEDRASSSSEHTHAHSQGKQHHQTHHLGRKHAPHLSAGRVSSQITCCHTHSCTSFMLATENETSSEHALQPSIRCRLSLYLPLGCRCRCDGSGTQDESDEAGLTDADRRQATAGIHISRLPVKTGYFERIPNYPLDQRQESIGPHTHHSPSFLPSFPLSLASRRIVLHRHHQHSSITFQTVAAHAAGYQSCLPLPFLAG